MTTGGLPTDPVEAAKGKARLEEERPKEKKDGKEKEAEDAEKKKRRKEERKERRMKEDERIQVRFQCHQVGMAGS